MPILKKINVVPLLLLLAFPVSLFLFAVWYGDSAWIDGIFFTLIIGGLILTKSPWMYVTAGILYVLEAVANADKVYKTYKVALWKPDDLVIPSVILVGMPLISLIFVFSRTGPLALHKEDAEEDLEAAQ